MSGALKVRRETRIISEEMKLRRTDLDIMFGNQGAVRVEVKIRDAGYLDLQQLMDLKNHSEYFLHYVFLVRSGSLKGCKGKFEIRYWKDVCLNLRRMMPRLSLVFMQKAMIMAFVGAVEQNILKLPGNLPQLIASKVRINSSVGKHIAEGLKGRVI